MQAQSLHRHQPERAPAFARLASPQPSLEPAVTHPDLPAPGAARELLIPGAAGAIETLIAAPRESPRGGFSVICHPHPLYGGAMSNKVTYTLASIALKAGLYALRFNFRGVGRSEGAHDQGRGETDDVLQLVRWMRARLGAEAPLLLAGFSFGGFVSLRAAQAAQPRLQISIAPPFGGREAYIALPPPPRPDCPWLVVHSRDDELVPYEDTRAALARYQPPPQLATLDGAGHFFHGRLGDLQQIADAFVDEHWPRG